MLYGLCSAFDGIQLEPPRGVEEAAKAGFEVFRLFLIVDEANTHRPQILANFMRAFFQRLRRNKPNESGAEDFSVLSEDERLGKCDNGYSSVAQSYWQRCEHGNGQCAWQCDLVNIHGEYKSSTAYTRNIARYNSWYERDFSCIEFLATVSARANAPLHYITIWNGTCLGGHVPTKLEDTNVKDPISFKRSF